ncbi:YIP1 family protein [Tabrizicola aquatica]|uniref:YIP1 family protein n=1 Tax=Tabrizicola aquatica TaxID=909926 RepID=UPI000CD2EDE1|nr:YIP1 family protein [Tabrizicola aquatica]
MTGLPARILELVGLSLRDPRAGLRALQAEQVPLAARSAGLLLMAVLSTILLQAGFVLAPPGPDPVAIFLAQSPFQTAVVQWLVLILSAVLIFRVGRAFDGHGSLADAILVVVWLQLVMLGVQLLQLTAFLLVPPLGGLLGIIGFGVFLWLSVNFIAELHGFRSLGLVFLGMFLTALAAVFAVAVILSFLFGPEALTNV